MTTELPIRIRGVLPDDVTFVIKTWLRDYRDEVPRSCTDKTYYHEHQEVIGYLSSRSIMKVACDINIPSIIYGFAVGKAIPEGKVLVLHYVYLRPEWRRLGIGTELIRSLGYESGWEIVASHWKTKALQWMTLPGEHKYRPIKRFPFIEHNPYILHRRDL